MLGRNKERGEGFSEDLGSLRPGSLAVARVTLPYEAMAEPKRKLTYADLQITPDDGRRFELVRGALLVTPSPRPRHQRISLKLTLLLHGYFVTRGIGEVFAAPTDVILTPEDVFVPDLLVVGNAGDVTERGIEAPPLLIVEILSPSTRNQDRGVKAERYAELGVLHYWMVDPERRIVDCFRLRGDAYERIAGADGGSTLTHPDWEGFAVDLADLWP